MLRSRLITIAQLLPCILLLVLGWGPRDMRTFFLDPAHIGLAVLTLAGGLAVVVCGWELHPLRGGSEPLLGNQNLQLGMLWLLSLALLWFLPFADRRRILTLRGEYWRYLGLLLCCFGVGVRALALRALGGYFSAYVTLQPDHCLVRHGIYARIRHPLYLSLLLVPTGIALVFASFLALPIFLLAALFVFDRIRQEECLLKAHFGLEFEEYRRSTWKLIPRLL